MCVYVYIHTYIHIYTDILFCLLFCSVPVCLVGEIDLSIFPSDITAIKTVAMYLSACVRYRLVLAVGHINYRSIYGVFWCRLRFFEC